MAENGGGFLDFLFEGKPPKSVTTYGETIKDVPKWLSAYTQAMLGKANQAAAEPYIAYGGPRISGFDPMQEAGFGMAEEAAGAYQPYMEGAAGATVGGLEAANRTFPGAVDEYMNPYIQNVLDRQESLATRTLEEDFLPSLQKTFAGAGQYGSRGGRGSMEDIGVRGMRDIQENLEQQRLATLGGAYGQAGELFGADVGRQAQYGLAGGQQLGALGEAAQTMGMRGAGALEAVGAQRQQQGQRGMDLAYQDFLEQRELPFERVGFMSDVIRGLPSGAIPGRTRTEEYGPASVYQPSPLSQAAGAYGVYKGLKGDARGGYIRRYAKGGLARIRDMIDLSPEVPAYA